MKTSSSLNRIVAACLGGLLLLALTAHAQNSASPGKPSPASGSPGIGAMGGGALAPTGAGVASPQPSPNQGPTQPGIPLNNPQQTVKQQPLPDKQDLNAKNNLKAKFGSPMLGLEEGARMGLDNDNFPRTAPPPITLTPGVPVSVMVWDDTDIVHGTAPPPKAPDDVSVFLIRAKMNNVFPTGVAVPQKSGGGNVAGDKGVYLDRIAAPKKGGEGTPGIAANGDGTLKTSAAVSHFVRIPGPNDGGANQRFNQDPDVGVAAPKNEGDGKRFFVGDSRPGRIAAPQKGGEGTPGVNGDPIPGVDVKLNSGSIAVPNKGGGSGKPGIAAVSEYTIANGLTSGRITGVAADPSDPKGVEAKGTHTISASYPGSGGFKRLSNPVDGGDGKLPSTPTEPPLLYPIDVKSIASPQKGGDGKQTINLSTSSTIGVDSGSSLTTTRIPQGGPETPGFKIAENASPRPTDRILFGDNRPMGVVETKAPHPNNNTIGGTVSGAGNTVAKNNEGDGKGLFVGDSSPGRIAAAQKGGFEKTFLDGSPASKAGTEPTSGGTEKPGIFVRGAQPVIVNNEMASSPKDGNGTPGISDQAAGGVLTSYHTAPPPNVGGGKPPPFDGKDVNGDRHSTNDKSVSGPSQNGGKAIPTANVRLTLNTNVTRENAPQDGGDGNGNRQGIIPAVQAQREAARRLQADGNSVESARVHLVCSANGQLMPFAEVQIKDASGKTVGTGTADEKGCVSWTPTTPGKFTMSVRKGDGSPNKKHSYLGTVTLVR